MPFQKIINSVPEFYHPFLPGVFHKVIPPEPFSDCLNCPMVARSIDETGYDNGRPFSPHTKCCTFIPRLPNYLAGAILSDTDPLMEEGKKRVIERINSGKGIIPNGVYPTNEYNMLYQEKSRTDFGRNEKLLCPFFKQGDLNCTIWKYREAICALWFCKHIAGQKGTIFWNSVIGYMKFMQEWLLNIAAGRCGLDPADPYGEGTYRSFRESDGKGNKGSSYTDIWKHWEGNEIEYYIQCYEIVSGLDQKEIENILHHGEILAKRIETLADDIVNIPDIMTVNKDLLTDDHDGNYIIEISNNIEILQRSIVWTFRLPKKIPDSFDGTTKTTTIIKKLEESEGFKIEPEILIALYNQGILMDERK